MPIGPSAWGGSGWLRLVFVFALAVQLAVLAVLPYFVTVDGPAHLGLAAAFWDSVLGAGSVVTRYATIQVLPATNLIPDLPAGLVGLVAGPQVAEKLLIAGLLAGIPLATLYAVRGVAPGRWWLAFLVIPLAPTFTLFYGFYPFCYGVLGLVLVMGYVVRNRGRWTRRSALMLAALLTGTFAAHVLPFVVALLFMGVAAAVEWVASGDLPRSRIAAAWMPAFIAALPGIGLTCFLVAQGLLDERARLVGDGVSTGESRGSALIQLAGVLGLSWGTATFDVREAIVAGAIAVTLLGLTILALWRRRRSMRLRDEDAYLIFGILVLLAAVLLPRNANFGAGGSHVTQRLAPIPVFGLLLWLGAADLSDLSQTRSARLPWLVAVIATIATVGLAGLRLPYQRNLSSAVEAYVAVAPCLATDATMLQVNLGRVTAGPLDRTSSENRAGLSSDWLV